jgi:4'-phosphopantetheinyl transferase EntD
MAAVGRVIHAILPASVSAAESRVDLDVVLFPEERASVAHAVESVRRQFATGRGCARRALAGLGLAPCAVPRGANGEPLWPSHIVGSITHCDGYRGCAVARAAEIATVGVDAEPNAPLPRGLLADIATPAERHHLEDLKRLTDCVHWERLLFSAKESVYKAWFPLTKRRLGFEDATVRFDVAAGTFFAGLVVAGPRIDGRSITGFAGRWIAEDGLLVTAITVETLDGGLNGAKHSVPRR